MNRWSHLEGKKLVISLKMRLFFQTKIRTKVPFWRKISASRFPQNFSTKVFHRRFFIEDAHVFIPSSDSIRFQFGATWIKFVSTLVKTWFELSNISYQIAVKKEVGKWRKNQESFPEKQTKNQRLPHLARGADDDGKHFQDKRRYDTLFYKNEVFYHVIWINLHHSSRKKYFPDRASSIRRHHESKAAARDGFHEKNRLFRPPKQSGFSPEIWLTLGWQNVSLG